MILVLFCIISLLWFLPSLQVFFVQDDFWLLSISRTYNIIDFANFFRPLDTAVWYRPLSSQLYFWASKSLFGLEPLYFHLISIITHALSAYFLYKFTLQLQKNQQIAIISGVIYLLHQIHNISVSWPASYSFVITPLLIILTLYFHFSNKKWLAIIYFAFALLSSETSLLLPFILTLFSIFKYRKVDNTTLAFWLPAAIIIILRWFVFPTSNTSELYGFELTSRLFSTFQFYILRLLGIPLGFPLLDINQKILHIICASLFTFVIVKAALTKKFYYWSNEKLNFIYVLLIIAGLAPFLFLSNHVAPYYASIALLGYAPLLANSLVHITRQVKHNFLLVLFFLTIFMAQQLSGHIWQYDTHWLYRRAELAKRLIIEAKLEHPVGTEEYFALGANKAKDIYGRTR